MKQAVQQSTTVPYSAGEMFALINDIEKYPEFLPWCHKAQVHSEDDSSMTASIGIAKGGMQQTLTTKNVLEYAKKIEMNLISGPFNHLYGRWEFEALEERSCKVNFHIEFTVASKLLNMIFTPAFKKMSHEMTDAFLDRAKVCYGSA